ncbi:UNVERIFIED_CONTAM: hypothetical protein K2H54_038396 [Gekko kuhli]
MRRENALIPQFIGVGGLSGETGQEEVVSQQPLPANASTGEIPDDNPEGQKEMTLGQMSPAMHLSDARNRRCVAVLMDVAQQMLHQCEHEKRSSTQHHKELLAAEERCLAEERRQ